MAVAEKIEQDLKAAMRAQDVDRLSTLRMLTAALKNAQIEQREKFSDDTAIAVLRREAKKRKEAGEAFTTGGRLELAAKELAELQIIESYLPAQLSAEQIEAAVTEAVSAAGGAPQFGQVMKVAMQKLKGQADGKVVGEMVKKILARTSG